MELNLLQKDMLYAESTKITSDFKKLCKLNLDLVYYWLLYLQIFLFILITFHGKFYRKIFKKVL